MGGMPTSKLTVGAGARTGAFAFTSRNRKTWSVDGPHFRGWEVNHVSHDPAGVYAATTPGQVFHSRDSGNKLAHAR